MQNKNLAPFLLRDLIALYFIIVEKKIVRCLTFCRVSLPACLTQLSQLTLRSRTQIRSILRCALQLFERKMLRLCQRKISSHLPCLPLLQISVYHKYSTVLCYKKVTSKFLHFFILFFEKLYLLKRNSAFKLVYFPILTFEMRLWQKGNVKHFNLTILKWLQSKYQNFCLLRDWK